MTPETVKETTEGGLPIRDLFAFAGVRQIMCREQIKEMLDEQMPEWDAVCKAVYEANESSSAAKLGGKGQP
jgi:hypothetical protein